MFYIHVCADIFLDSMLRKTLGIKTGIGKTFLIREDNLCYMKFNKGVHMH